LGFCLQRIRGGDTPYKQLDLGFITCYNYRVRWVIKQVILGVAPTRYRLMIDTLDDSTSYCWDGLGEDVPKGLKPGPKKRCQAKCQAGNGSKAAIDL